MHAFRSPVLTGYEDYLHNLKQRIQAPRPGTPRVVLAVNRELILLYWRISREILDRQDQPAGERR